LNAAGFNCGAADGVLGVRTQTALKQFQTEKGLPIGNLNIQTLEALGVSN
jgi:peptidoglycan hydrolase-like protein with peptidoglycan-binding domain